MKTKLSTFNLPSVTGTLTAADSADGDAGYSGTTLAIDEIYLQDQTGKILDDGIILEQVFQAWIPKTAIEGSAVPQRDQKITINSVVYQISAIKNQDYGLIEDHWQITLEDPNA